ncbi:MAG: 6,7-dimethyl-8-ribityllumazine synthase [Deltaproteobacteria bacterium]|jgi:6,7-dimethyl-8-ribityllumazine synthase|nr:6,7-dimethyl-8-ribityllumazine synthase [Deltaproteobacteria bacterium]
MVKAIEGQISAKGLKVALLASRFNGFITERLLDGAKDAFFRHGGLESDLTVIKAPGSFELPLVAQVAASTGRYEAIIALGAVIRGQTPHFDYVAAEVTKGLAQVALKANIPISFGVLTCDTLEQAVDRAGAKSGNKGFEAVVTALEMVNVLRLVKEA